MIRHEGKQGSDAWRQARAGVVTASVCDKILTPATLKPSKSQDAMIHRLAAEIILGRPMEDEAPGKFIDRGTIMEGEAVAWYEFDRNVATEEVGFLTTDDGRVGCSPDRLVGSDGGLEIKCPSAPQHVGYLLNPASLVAEYRSQVQVGLYVTGRAWWDLVSYNPEIPPVVQRVTPDLDYIAALQDALGDFLIRLGRAVESVKALLAKDDLSAAAFNLFK